MILFVVVLPVLLAFGGGIMDTAHAFGEKRRVQNAADSAALAAALDLKPVLACADDVCRNGYRPTVRAAAEGYSAANGGASSLVQCANGAQTNCYTWPYNGSWAKIEVRLQNTAEGFFTRLLGLSSGFLKASARAVAGAAPVTETHCVIDGEQRDELLPDCVLPGHAGVMHCIVSGGDYGPNGPNGDGTCQLAGTPGILHCFINGTDYGTDYSPCQLPGQVQVGNFAFAGSTACDAVKVSHGGETFSGIWSNGGVTASGAKNTAGMVRVGNTSCAFPSQFNPPGPTASAQRAYGGGLAQLTVASAAGSTSVTVDDITGFAVGQTIWIDAGAGRETRTISAVNSSQKRITVSTAFAAAHGVGVVVTNTDWPLPLPAPPSSCTSGNGVIDAAWLSTHPGGSYCFTGSVDIKVSFSGYTFVSYSTATNAIKCAVNGVSMTAPSTPNPSPKDNLLLYAVRGGIAFSGQVSTTGMLFAPAGLIKFSAAANTASAGFFMADKIEISNGPTNFTGSGPGSTGTSPILGEWHEIGGTGAQDGQWQEVGASAPRAGARETSITGVQLSMDE